MVICLERYAELHMAQLMPLPLTVSCFSKIQVGFFPFWYRLTRVVPEKGPLNGCVCYVWSHYCFTGLLIEVKFKTGFREWIATEQLKMVQLSYINYGHDTKMIAILWV